MELSINLDYRLSLRVSNKDNVYKILLLIRKK